MAELLGFIKVRQTMALLHCLHHISKQWRRKAHLSTSVQWV